MPLPSYVTKHLGAKAWAALQPWYDSLDDTPDRKLIRRNIDRECDRADIDPQKWLRFLRDVSAAHGAGADAVETIDTILKGNRSSFALPGQPLPPLSDSQPLFRLMRLDHFLKFMLSHLPIVASPLTPLAADINNGKITGADLDSRQFGRPDYPIWCTLSKPPNWRVTADRARDRFGLKHIDTGHMVEMEYPVGLLKSQPVELKPPTVIDSWAAGASNWIFSKRRGTGGPDWGYTVDMDGGGPCAKGSTEAVHASFTIPAGQGYNIGLQVYGPVANSAPPVSYGKLLLNVAV